MGKEKFSEYENGRIPSVLLMGRYKVDLDVNEVKHLLMVQRFLYVRSPAQSVTGEKGLVGTRCLQS